MRELNIIVDMAEATHITSNPRSGKLGTINEEEEDDDDQHTREGMEFPHHYFVWEYTAQPTTSKPSKTKNNNLKNSVKK